MRNFVVLILFWLCSSAVPICGQGVILLDSPRDDFDARLKIAKAHETELAKPGNTYNELTARLRHYRAGDIKRVFGADIQPPDSAVRPIFGGDWTSLPGIITDFHRRWYAVGDLGFIEYCFDDDLVLNAVLYFRSDDSFVPVRNENDFKKRFRWDLKRLEQLQRWTDDHPPDHTGT